MTRQLAMFIHVMTVGLQGLNALGVILPTLGLPAKYQLPLTVALGMFQGAVGWLQHNFNPDGTPAAVAYAPSGAK